MAKAWLVLGVCVLGAPVLGLSAAAVAENAGHGAQLLKALCIVTLALTVLVPSLYVALAHVLARRREAFARFFPAIVRGALFSLVTVLALQGALSLMSAMALMIASPADHGALLFVAAGVGFLYASLLVLSEGRNIFEPQAISVTGIKLSPHRLPGLHARVHRLAARMGVKTPIRIILGLEPTCFVTSAAVNLRGMGALPPAPTLFLSTMALRALNKDEVDAVLGHELGHFRGDDLAFSQRFAPAFMSLTRALESVSMIDGDEPAWSRLPRLPAIATLSGIMYVLYRAVSGISREREFAADRVASEVAPRSALVSALIKMQAISPYWENARRENASFVAQGKFRRNLATDYLQGVRNRLQHSPDGDAAAVLAEARSAHPLDTHPTLHERAAALSVEPNGLIAHCLESLHAPRDHDDALGRIEQQLTWTENDFVRPPVIARQPRWSD